MTKMIPGSQSDVPLENCSTAPAHLRGLRFVVLTLLAGLGIGIIIGFLRLVVEGFHWRDGVTDMIVGGATGATVGIVWLLMRQSILWTRNLRWRFSLRTMLVVVAIAPFAVYVGWLLVVIRPIKAKYERARSEISPVVLNAVPMNAGTERLLADVRGSWTETDNDLAGPTAQALKMIGRKPCVSNAVKLYTYHMPDFSILLPRQNYLPSVIGTIQAQILPVTTDRSIHVSEDGSIALIHVSPVTVFLFEDHDQGMREIVYMKVPKTGGQ